MFIKRIRKQNEMIRKEMGFVYVVPMLVLFLVLPVWFCFILRNDLLDASRQYEQFLSVTEVIVPFFSVFWIVFSAYDWVESDGRELYYLYEKKPDRVAGFYALLFHVPVLFTYLIYGCFLKGFFYEYVRISAICIFFQGIVLWLMYLLRSQTIAYFAAFLYIGYSLFSDMNAERTCICYLSNMPKDMGKDYFRSGCFLLIGIGFWIGGALVCRRFGKISK
ncbi:MAG: hypothetical protein HDR01_04120 [Lachnospiraceae bacterium]|nr:hypothetical protein [Lachnospiraceae bacterium]